MGAMRGRGTSGDDPSLSTGESDNSLDLFAYPPVTAPAVNGHGDPNSEPASKTGLEAGEITDATAPISQDGDSVVLGMVPEVDGLEHSRSSDEFGPFRVSEVGATGDSQKSLAMTLFERVRPWLEARSTPAVVGVGAGLISAFVIIAIVGSDNGTTGGEIVADAPGPNADGVDSEANGGPAGGGGRSQFSRSLSGSAGAAGPVAEGQPDATDDDQPAEVADSSDELEASAEEPGDDQVDVSSVEATTLDATSTTQTTLITTTVLAPEISSTATTLASTTTSTTEATTTTTGPSSTTTTTEATTTTTEPTTTTTTAPELGPPTSCEVWTPSAEAGVIGVAVQEPSAEFAPGYALLGENGAEVARVSTPQLADATEIGFDAQANGFDADLVFAVAAVVDGEVSAATTCSRQT